MLKRMRPSLRESSPFLVNGLRVLDSGIVALLLYPIVMLHIGEWSDHYESLLLLSFFLSLIIFHFWGLYKPWRGQTYLSEIRVISGAWITLACAIVFLLFAFKIGVTFSRVVLTTWFTITPLFLFLLHGFSRALLRRLRSRGKNIRSAVIVGAEELGLLVADHIQKMPWSGIHIQGFFDDSKTTDSLAQNGCHQGPVLGALNDLPEYLESNNVDFVYITLPFRQEEEIQRILRSCRTFGARIYLVPDLYAFQAFNSRIQRFGDMLLLDFNPDSPRKRAFDVCFSLLVLLMTLPLTLIIALLIKLQDGGPVFYGHPRITLAGKKFHCLKFRSMYKNADKKLNEILENDPEARAEWNQYFKLKNDPRVTWIGKFLRKTSLDELPQFINVLKGEMSVVGARPIVARELCDYYGENGGLYCSLKPGITGPWQVSKRNDTEDYQERVQLDTWYVLNRNFWMDLRIVVKTVGRMISGKGAY